MLLAHKMRVVLKFRNGKVWHTCQIRGLYDITLSKYDNSVLMTLECRHSRSQLTSRLLLVTLFCALKSVASWRRAAFWAMEFSSFVVSTVLKPGRADSLAPKPLSSLSRRALSHPLKLAIPALAYCQFKLILHQMSKHSSDRHTSSHSPFTSSSNIAMMHAVCLYHF